MTQRTPAELPRDGFDTIPIYRTGAAVEVNLADNTNLWGTPPHAAAALRAGLDVAEYPDLYGQSLKETVAVQAGIDTSCVVTGNGSDDILDCAIRAFAAQGDTIAHPDPTFVMLPVFGRINGVTPVAVPLTASHTMDVDALLATGARIIYLCQPNNPTGTSTPAADIRRVIAEAPGLVILDEAYVEFSGDPGLIAEAPSLGRVVVARTLSKAYGLAGLRVGYGVASPEITATIERSRGPYKLNALAERAAVAAMTLDHDWVVARAADAVVNRDRFAAELATRGLVALPSATNFLCVPTARAAEYAEAARARGVGIRAFASLPGIGGALRITAGPWAMMERLLAAMDTVR
jgi:histidinol-phosphate aminotransferase